MQRSRFVIRRLGLVVGLAAAAFAPQVFGDDLPPQQSKDETPDIAIPTDADLADKRIAFTKAALGRYTIKVTGHDEPATVSDACLRWTNPVSGSKDGVLAVFTFGGGRPAVIGQFFHVGPKRWVNEFAIIATDDVTIMRSGQRFWKPAEYICKFADVPDAPTPSEKAPLRLAQMRKIAGDFTVVDQFGWEEAKITPHNLRLLTQPVYRYAEEGKIIDGALFVYAVGTDPECNLLIEAYSDEKGARYRYALAPMSIYQLEARYKDREVWGIERRIVFGGDCSKYYALTYGPAPGENVPE
jgi:hypothetical protein